MAPALLAAMLPAQIERYELGLRVRAMEREFESRRGDNAAHRRALGELQNAVTAFFALRLGESGRALDHARHALRGTPASEAQEWADALVFRPERRLVDAGTTTLEVRVEAFYRVDVEPPESASLRIVAVGGEVIGGGPLTGLPAKFQIKVPTQAWSGDGKHEIQFVVSAGPSTLRHPWQSVFVVSELDRRMRALAEGAASLPPQSPGVDAATLHGHLDTLRALRAGKSLESEVHAGELLAQAERLLQSLTEGRPYFAGRSSGNGSFTLRMPVARAAAPVRVSVPRSRRPDDKLPLVIALHGAGASEHLFFEGYGDGLAARLCHQRRWILAAPRNASAGAVPRLVDQLAALWPVDRARVFLVGHSMGAITAVAAACAAPQRYRGVAALGGGGAVRQGEGLVALPFFVAAGSADVGRSGGLGLVDALRQAAVKDVRWREYPDIEHLVIVQAALPDVFGFFDACAGAAAPASQPGRR